MEMGENDELDRNNWMEEMIFIIARIEVTSYFQ